MLDDNKPMLCSALHIAQAIRTFSNTTALGLQNQRNNIHFDCIYMSYVVHLSCNTLFSTAERYSKVNSAALNIEEGKFEYLLMLSYYYND